MHLHKSENSTFADFRQTLLRKWFRFLDIYSRCSRVLRIYYKENKILSKRTALTKPSVGNRLRREIEKEIEKKNLRKSIRRSLRSECLTFIACTGIYT